MIDAWPINKTAFKCDICHEPAIGTANQVTCRKSDCQRKKNVIISRRQGLAAKKKRAKKREAQLCQRLSCY